jgi:hypothetical protein
MQAAAAGGWLAIDRDGGCYRSLVPLALDLGAWAPPSSPKNFSTVQWRTAPNWRYENRGLS